MEICVRYYQFFEQNPHLIPKVLENFVQLTHSTHVKVRSRSWYLFQRLVKHLRAQLGNVSYDIIQAVGDLLTIKAELPDTSEDEMSSDEEDQSADALFNSQLYLFEAVGCIASSNTVSAENKKLYAQTIMSPLFTDLEQTLPQARNGDDRATLQIHHIIMALGTLARGYSDWVPSNNNSAVPQTEVADEFVKASEAILVALESLNTSGSIRHAARFAFSRTIAVLGPRLLQQLPSWIEGLLSLSSSMDEISTFLKVLGQVVFTFKSEISGILDTVMTPVLQRIFTALATTPSGTDDEIQLAELRREYLNFIIVVLNQGLGSVLVSNSRLTVGQLLMIMLTHYSKPIFIRNYHLIHRELCSGHARCAYCSTGHFRAHPHDQCLVRPRQSWTWCNSNACLTSDHTGAATRLRELRSRALLPSCMVHPSLAWLQLEGCASQASSSRGGKSADRNRQEGRRTIRRAFKERSQRERCRR
jgi:exportin-T